jgi:ABC-type iron transport system FetAB permease component
MNPYHSPIMDPSSPDSPRSTPPGPVSMGVNLIAISVLLGFAKIAYQWIEKGSVRMGDTKSILSFGIGTVIIIAMVYFLLRSIYRGRKLALWIYLIFSILTIASLTLIFRQWNVTHFSLEKTIYVAQGVLQIFAALLLILPPSWRWFHPKRPL